jgi:hypothetical protein
LASNVCLSSTGAWFTATISGIGSSPVELVGTLQETIGSGNELGYVFRGTLSPSDSVTGPLAGAVQFVVEVAVTEPDNTAQLTIVFLGSTPNPAGVGDSSQPALGSNTTGSSTDPSTASTGSGTGDTSSTTTGSDPVNALPVVTPIGTAATPDTPSIDGVPVTTLSPLSAALAGHGVHGGTGSTP